MSLDALKAAGAKPPALTVSSNQGRGEDFFFIYGRRAGANVAMADGSVRYLPPGRLSTEKLLKILQMGGYGKEGVESYAASYNAEPVRLNWPNIAALAVWLLSVGVMLTCAVRSRKARL